MSKWWSFFRSFGCDGVKPVNRLACWHTPFSIVLQTQYIRLRSVGSFNELHPEIDGKVRWDRDREGSILQCHGKHDRRLERVILSAHANHGLDIDDDWTLHQ